jgi:hypothetical protein
MTVKQLFVKAKRWNTLHTQQGIPARQEEHEIEEELNKEHFNIGYDEYGDLALYPRFGGSKVSVTWGRNV